jgi:iron complex outermembrane receptor protein
MVFLAGLTRHVRTRGLQGDYTLGAALDELLAGTGLTYRLAEDGREVLILLAQNDGARNDASGAEALPPIDVGAAEGEAREGARRDSNNGNGPGGRFTGYAPDLSKPAASSKTNVPLLQTPLNIQSVTREMLDDRQATNLKDALLDSVSSVSVSYQQLDHFIVRGFDLGNEIYRNGLRTPMAAGRDTANLQSIEVLKGPAAMLYGRIEPGGLINMVTKRPLFDPYYSIQEQTGSFGLTRTSIDVTGPATSDKTLAYRLNALYSRSDSFRDFVTSRSTFFAPALTWRPTEDFRLNVEAEYRNAVFVDMGDVGIPAVGRTLANVPISRYYGDPSITVGRPNRQETAFAGYDWTYDIDPDWSITNRFGYSFEAARRTSVYIYPFDETTGIGQRDAYLRDRHLNTVSMNFDVKGAFHTGFLKHRVLLGVDYLSQELRDSGYDGGQPFISPIDIYAPVYSSLRLSNLAAIFPYNNFTRRRENWKGVYGQDFISFADDHLHLLLGGRYDWSSYGSSYSPNSMSESDANFRSAFDEAFSPNVGVVAQPWSWLTFYANFAQSFGVSNGIPTPGQPLFSPQKGTQFEGGVKAELLDGRLTATFAYYDIVKSNILRPVPNSPFSTPIGEAESQGVEFDLAGRVDENWSVIATYSHDDARITTDSTKAGTTGNQGHRLANVPLDAGSFWMKYDGQGELHGLSLGAGVVAVGRREGNDANDFQLPAYARVDVFGSYRLPLPNPVFTVQLNVKNLFDERYFESSAAFDRMTNLPGAPRSFFVSLRAEF